MGKVVLEAPVDRVELLEYVKAVIEVSFEKLRLANTKNSEKQGWCRVINNAIATATPLIKDKDLDDLKSRLEEVESRLRIGVAVVS